MPPKKVALTFEDKRQKATAAYEYAQLKPGGGNNLSASGIMAKLKKSADFYYLPQYHVAGTQAEVRAYLATGGQALESTTFYSQQVLGDARYVDLIKAEGEAASRLKVKSPKKDKYVGFLTLDELASYFSPAHSSKIEFRKAQKAVKSPKSAKSGRGKKSTKKTSAKSGSGGRTKKSVAEYLAQAQNKGANFVYNVGSNRVQELKPTSRMIVLSNRMAAAANQTAALGAALQANGYAALIPEFNAKVAASKQATSQPQMPSIPRPLSPGRIPTAYPVPMTGGGFAPLPR